MYGLPISTIRKQQLPKKTIYAKFELKQSQRDAVDADIVRMDFVNSITPQTMPALAEGTEVKAIFVVEVQLKRADYEVRNMALIAKLIPQRIILALRYGEKVQLAAYHTKFIVGTLMPSGRIWSFLSAIWRLLRETRSPSRFSPMTRERNC